MTLPEPGEATLRHRETGRTDPDAVDATLAASGDGRAFERLYRSHVGRICRLVRLMMGDEETDDVTQDVFVRAWQKLDTFRGEAAFGTWLHRLAINVVLGRRQARSTWRQRYLDSDASLVHLPGRRTSPDLALDFETAVARLPDGARQVFVLHDIEGYRHGEIGEMLGLAVGTSKSQLHWARMALRHRLGNEGSPA